jgi:hypothetical protein
MRLPAYPTQFLACLEGNHTACRHTDSPGLITWVCQCECHPRELDTADNNYAKFPPLPAEVQEIVRYSSKTKSGLPRGLRQCRNCGELNGRTLSPDPLQWHKGLHEKHCLCALLGQPADSISRMRDYSLMV